MQQIHFRFYLGLKKSIVSTWTFRNFKNDQTFKYILRGEVSKSSNYIFAVVFGFKKCIGTGGISSGFGSEFGLTPGQNRRIGESETK